MDDSQARANGEAIRKGDLIVSVEGEPTADLKSYLPIAEKPGVGVVSVFAGDLIRVGIQRKRESMELQIRVRPEVDRPGRSLRRSGFACVFDAEIQITPEQCGGPVVNRLGEVVGVVIAQNGHGRTYVVPATAAKQVVRTLSNEAH